MSPALQQWLVGIVVAGATLYAAWRLMPGRARDRLLAALEARLPAEGDGPAGRLRAAIARRRARLAAGGCASCGDSGIHARTHR